MKVFASGRRTGRTTELIKLCAEAEKAGQVAYMVCHSQQEAYRVTKLAKEMGYEGLFRFPISYEEFLNAHGAGFTTRYFIDNAEFLIQLIANGVKVEAISVTTDE